ncbi:hypothetical protein GpartN1_g7674.t1 [Galdieria partita]|uniref:Alpha-galactosidase n=1 Tax=Galdieria partita TaxID=83374 RepID=A0A9C7Q3L1_9RHOD|nr:hypothetical protein GpartN1_g7674.t1 [Galdieria partita]
MNRPVTLFGLVIVTCCLSITFALDNGLARTPPMGYDTWNFYHCNYDGETLMKTAKAMKDAGMLELGYEYIYPDDCWEAPERAPDGSLQPNPFKFPHGIKPVIDYIHSLGFKFGIYNCAGTRTCAGFPGSYGHYEQNAQQFADWGVDYIKFDWCNVPFWEFPGWSHEQVAQKLYSDFRDALNKTGRHIVFSMCNGWDPDVYPWRWASDVANLWRTTDDIADSYDVMRDRYEQNILHGSKAGPGHWNNPDMLEVGNGGMTTEEYITHFSLWSIMAAPLVIGTDVTNMTESTKMILTNKEVIDVDQDVLGVQGIRVKSDIAQDVVTKPLANGDVAIVLFSSNGPGVINTTIEQVRMPSYYDVYILRDLWTRQETTIRHFISAYVQGHGVKMYRIRPGKPQDAPPHHVIYFNPSPMMLTESPKRYGASLRIENVGASTMQHVDIQLHTSSQVKVVPLTAMKYDAIHEMEQVEVSWHFEVPSDKYSGSYPVSVTVSYTYPYAPFGAHLSETFNTSIDIPDLVQLGKEGTCHCSSS